VDELAKRIAAAGGPSLRVVRIGEPSRSDPQARTLALSSVEVEESAEIRKQLAKAEAEAAETSVVREKRHAEALAAAEAKSVSEALLAEILERRRLWAAELQAAAPGPEDEGSVAGISEVDAEVDFISAAR
jgi:hypothetical protein